MVEPAQKMASASAAPGKESLDRLRAFVSELEKEAERRAQQKQPVEQRWLEDLRQLHGQYEATVQQDLRESGKSQLFVNVTRPKTNAAAARLNDMLFPTDDKNWGIEPTPVPELHTIIDEGEGRAKKAAEEANRLMAQGMPQDAEALVEGTNDNFASAAAEARRRLDIAKDRSAQMSREIEDQQRECRYNIQARDVIEDGCRLGTGIMKGPVLSMQPRRRWRVQRDEETGGVQHVLDGDDGSPRPAFYRADPWHVFPDPDALRPEDSESWFERHLCKKRDLRRLARLPGFNKDEIRELLKSEPTETIPTYIADLRSITNIQNAAENQCFWVWEYYGAVTGEDLLKLAEATGQTDMIQDYEDVDPLDEIHICVWFCQGHILKFAEHPLDSGEALYSFFCYEKDEGSIWGLGVPRIMQNSQSAINAAWRMLFDNAGYSAGPQIFIDAQFLEPVNGVCEVRANKIWKIKSASPNGHEPFKVAHINGHHQELMAIVEMVRRIIDDETGISQLAQGEQGAEPTKTAKGMAILMNSTNVVFRRIVKSFDDDLTTPCIRRHYHWLMQFSDKESIKGDYEVVARGSSVLMVREIQGQNLLSLLNMATANPHLQSRTKITDAYRKAVQSLQIPADDFVMSDDEIEQEEQRRAENQVPDPAMARIEADLAIAKMEHDGRERIAMLAHETKMMTLAEQMNMSVEELRAKVQLEGQRQEADERRLATEAAMAEATGKSAGGSV